MIHEYAIEPEVVVSFATNGRDYRYVMENFGLGKTRLMGEFPKLKNWRKQFRIASASLDDKSQKRLIELFKQLTEKKIERSNCVYDGTQNWLENAEKEHSRQQFTAILALKNPNKKNHIFLGADIGQWPEEIWETKDKITVPRQPDAMAKVLSPLLLKSRDIIFIDPYFRANRKDFRDVLQIFLQEAVKCPIFSEKRRVEVHVSADYEKVLSKDAFVKECQSEVPQLVPAGLVVKFKRWKQKQSGEKLHNRYILTNLGGVSFGVGLNAGIEGETDDLSLLHKDQFNQRWQQYASDGAAFELEHEFEIKGVNKSTSYQRYSS
jgi:hypothetical protein